MFQLRIEHEEALKRSAVKRFEARMLEHLWEHFPLAYQRLGTEQMRVVRDWMADEIWKAKDGHRDQVQVIAHQPVAPWLDG